MVDLKVFLWNTEVDLLRTRATSIIDIMKIFLYQKIRKEPLSRILFHRSFITSIMSSFNVTETRFPIFCISTNYSIIVSLHRQQPSGSSLPACSPTISLCDPTHHPPPCCRGDLQITPVWNCWPQISHASSSIPAFWPSLHFRSPALLDVAFILFRTVVAGLIFPQLSTTNQYLTHHEPSEKHFSLIYSSSSILHVAIVLLRAAGHGFIVFSFSSSLPDITLMRTPAFIEGNRLAPHNFVNPRLMTLPFPGTLRGLIGDILERIGRRFAIRDSNKWHYSLFVLFTQCRSREIGFVIYPGLVRAGSKFVRKRTISWFIVATWRERLIFSDGPLVGLFFFSSPEATAPLSCWVCLWYRLMEPQYRLRRLCWVAPSTLIPVIPICEVIKTFSCHVSWTVHTRVEVSPLMSPS